MHDKVIVICLANVFFPTSQFLHSNYKAPSLFYKHRSSKFKPPKSHIQGKESKERKPIEGRALENAADMSLVKVELILIFKPHPNITRFHLTSVLWGHIPKLRRQSHILKRLILHNSLAQRTLSLQKKTSHPEVAGHAESR